MNTLQSILDKVIRESFSPENIVDSIIKRKFKETGLVLNNKQHQQLKEQIKANINTGAFTFQFNEEEALDCPSSLKGLPNTSISLTIDAEKEWENIDLRIRETIENLIPQVAPELAEIILKTLKKSFGSFKTYHKKHIKSFYKGMEKEWGNPIDLLEMFCLLATEAGGDFNNQFRPLAAKDNNFVIDVLTRLHARSCQITSEIILLLRNGFADGAHARWRTLHEITSIGYFIAKHGNDVAERYLCHTAIEAHKAAIIYQKYCEALGYQRLTEEELMEIREKYLHYINKFGLSYKNPHGWASAALAKDHPTIADIESDVGLAHMRPYYKMASHNVHANPEGIFFKLGLIPESGDILLTGPSNLGLPDPGHSTAISLLQITTTLLFSSAMNLDRMVILMILINLEREIGEAFYCADKSLKEKVDSP
jgi:hypothetical protein